MSADLSLSEPHNANIIKYMRFARYQRDQRLRVVDSCFKDLKNGRLMEDTTFTRDELEDILCTLKEDIRTEFESELLHSAHTNVVLLSQLFQQAEKWHLTLAVDVAELENRELLQKIRDFEEAQFSSGGAGGQGGKGANLAPVNEFGGSTLLKMEIDRLQKENGEIRQRLLGVEESAVVLARARDGLLAEVGRLGGGKSSAAAAGAAGLDTRALERQVEQLRLDMQQQQQGADGDAAGGLRVQLQEDLAKTKQELLSIHAMLQLKEKELERKVGETVPFKNLKTMLVKKNEQLKELRQRLGKYEEL